MPAGDYAGASSDAPARPDASVAASVAAAGAGSCVPGGVLAVAGFLTAAALADPDPDGRTAPGGVRDGCGC
ncbi:hypothetical protein ACFXOS_10840 [Streptomyces sp. NPDC059175]|uniref:hypothetical protein n=1 Tax=Streptomyces sp. NPDC059175 TaxID=3346757 RepID=UPI0036A7FD78